MNDEEVWRRAGGRRGYNAVRRVRAMERRAKVYGLWQFGSGLSPSKIARHLKVSPSTISRDIAGLGVGFRLVLRQQRGATTLGALLARIPPRRQWAAVERATRPVPTRTHMLRGARMHKRLTIRLSDALVHQVETLATQRELTVSDVLREALLRYLEPAPPVSLPVPHTAEDCANALLQHCWPEERAWLLDTAASCNIPLERLLVVSVQHWWREGESAPSRGESSSNATTRPPEQGAPSERARVRAGTARGAGRGASHSSASTSCRQ